VEERGPLSPLAEDPLVEQSLRPTRFAEFVGQKRSTANLEVYIEAARRRGEPLDHILFSGQPGLGKTTLAHLIAREMGADIRVTSGPALDRAADLAGILTNLRRGDVLFVDEIHRLAAPVEEYLYSAMEDFTLDIVIDQGPNARSIRLPLERFTLVAATTREGLLTPPLRSRFGVHERLEPYPVTDLVAILERSARLLGVEIDDGAASVIASRSRGTPRIANRFLRRVRDFAQVDGSARVTRQAADAALARLGVDGNGLESLDRKILEFLASVGGGPVGLKTVSVAVGEEPDTIEDVYEPFLIQRGYLVKSPRGRSVTEAGCAAVRKPHPAFPSATAIGPAE
jgi:Holliday junction DNA helicase RuvB